MNMRLYLLVGHQKDEVQGPSWRLLLQQQTPPATNKNTSTKLDAMYVGVISYLKLLLFILTNY